MRWSRCPVCGWPRLVVRKKPDPSFVVRVHKSPWPERDHFAERVVKNAVCPGSGRAVKSDSVKVV